MPAAALDRSSGPVAISRLGRAPTSGRAMTSSKDLRYRLEYLAISGRPGGRDGAAARGRVVDFGPRLAPHRPPSLPAGAGAAQSGDRLSRAFASGAQADRGRHVGESRPHIRRIVPPQGDRRPEAGPLRAAGATRRNHPRRPMRGLRPASRQLGARRLRQQAHGRLVHRRLSASLEPAGRRGDPQASRLPLRRGSSAKNPGDRAGADEDGQERRLSGLPRRPARRQRRRRSVLRQARALDPLPRPARPQGRTAALRRRRIPRAERALRHPRRAGGGSPHARPWRRTRSPGPPRCRRSSRPSSARRPNNGCGPTGNGTSRAGGWPPPFRASKDRGTGRGPPRARALCYDGPPTRHEDGP